MLTIVIIYLVALLAVGGYYYKKAKDLGSESSDDFFLASRSLGKIVVAGTILATYTGSGTVTGGGNSLAYNYGFWPGVCFVLPPIFSMLVLVALSKKIYEGRCTTAAQLLEKSYGPSARIYAAVIITLAFVSIVSYQYRGLGFILNATTGLSIPVCTIICTVIVIALAFSGGLKTVATTDAMSAFLMTVGLVVGIPFLLKAVGGVDWVIANAPPEKLTFFGGQTFWKWAGGYLPLFFLTIGDQNFYQRIVASKDLPTARFGLYGCIVACLVIMPVVAGLSFIGSIYFGSNISAGQSLIATATLMPTVIGGVVLAAAAAFTITTGDSYLLSAASNVTIDIYANKINPGASDEEQLRVSRWFILLTGVLAYIILQFFPSVLAIQFWAYTIYGAGITPAVLCCLCWKRVTKAGGIASMLAGTAVTIGWEIFGKNTGVQTVLVAIPVSFLVIVLVSLMTQPKSRLANDPA
jgi:Na+/proline symporter